MTDRSFNDEIETQTALCRLVALAKCNLAALDSVMQIQTPPDDPAQRELHYVNALITAHEMAYAAKEAVDNYETALAKSLLNQREANEKEAA